MIRGTSTTWTVQVYIHGEKWIDYAQTKYRSNGGEMLRAARAIYPNKDFRLLRTEHTTSVIEVVEDE